MVNKQDLENRLNEFCYWQSQGSILKQNPWSSQQREALGAKISQGRAPEMLRGSTPDVLDRYILGYTDVSKDNVINYTKTNLTELVCDTAGENLIPAVLELNKEYVSMIKTLQENDKNKMKKYIDKSLFGNNPKLIKAFEYHASVNKDLVQSVYTREINYKARLFELSLNDKEVKDGKIIDAKVNKYKVEDYIAKNIDNATDSFYFSVVNGYLKSEAEATEAHESEAYELPIAA